MDDDEPIDLYRIIRLCGILVFGWLVQVFGFGHFRSCIRDGPPRFQIVDFGSMMSLDGKPVAKVLAEQTRETRVSLVSKERAAELVRTHQLKQWGGLTAGLCGLSIVAWSAWVLWGSWGAVVGAVVFGPAAIAAMRGREWR